MEKPNFYGIMPADVRYDNKEELWQRIIRKQKNELINKYGCECQICNKHFKKDDLCIEHIKAKSVGGTNKKENLSLVCRSCNSKKYNYNTGNFPIESFFNRPDFF